MAVVGAQHFGWRKHTYSLPLDSLEKTLKFGFAFDAVTMFAPSPIKLSILFFMRRLLGNAVTPSNRYYYAAIITLITIISLALIAAVVTTFLFCRYANFLVVTRKELQKIKR